LHPLSSERKGTEGGLFPAFLYTQLVKMKINYIVKKYNLDYEERRDMEFALDSKAEKSEVEFLSKPIFDPKTYLYKSVAIVMSKVNVSPYNSSCVICVSNENEQDLEDFLNIEEFKFLKENR